MNTTNVISTPDVTGNIGNCTSSTTTAVAQRLSFWKEEKVSFVTNSCDGTVREFRNVEYTGVAGWIFFILGFIVFLIFVGVISD